MSIKREQKTEYGNPRMVRIDGLCAYTSLGTSKAREFAESIGAKRKLGNTVFYDLKVIDAALDALCE